MKTLKLKFKLSNDFKIGDKYSFDVHDNNQDIFWYKTTAEYLGVSTYNDHVFLEKEDGIFNLIEIPITIVENIVVSNDHGRYYLNEDSVGTFVDYTVTTDDKGVRIETFPKQTHYVETAHIKFEDVARELYKKVTRKS